MRQSGVWRARSTTIAARCKRLGRFGVVLHHAENVSFGIFAVGQPADCGYRYLGYHAFSAGLFGKGNACVNIRYSDGIDARLVRVTLGHQSSVDPGFAFARRDEPVRHGSVPLVELPAK